MPHEGHGRGPLLARLLGGLVALAVLVFAVLHFGEARRFVLAAESARPEWLLAALAFQAPTYAMEAASWQGPLLRSHVRRRFAELYALSVVVLFTNQVVPSAGVAGSVLVVRALEARGVPPSVAVSAILVDLLGYWAGFGLSASFALVVLTVHRELSGAVLALAVGGGGLGALVWVGAVWVTAPGRQVPRLFTRIPGLRRVIETLTSGNPDLVRDPLLLLRSCALRTGNFLFDGLTLWTCVRAVGQDLPPTEAAAAFIIGALARAIVFIPGGLGAFEGGTVGGLALFGVPIEIGLAATLLFRGVSFWLPLVPGLWLGRRFAGVPRP